MKESWKNLPCCRQFLQKFFILRKSSVWKFHARSLNLPCFQKKLSACMCATCKFSLQCQLWYYNRGSFSANILCIWKWETSNWKKISIWIFKITSNTDSIFQNTVSFDRIHFFLINNTRWKVRRILRTT